MRFGAIYGNGVGSGLLALGLGSPARRVRRPSDVLANLKPVARATSHVGEAPSVTLQAYLSLIFPDTVTVVSCVPVMEIRRKVDLWGTTFKSKDNPP